jgi:hypothetical protein
VASAAATGAVVNIDLPARIMALKTRYVAETLRRRKDGEEWALEMKRDIDRNGPSKPRVVRRTRPDLARTSCVRLSREWLFDPNLRSTHRA